MTAPIHTAVLAWYQRHARALPWRRTRDPYCILVSEIMLQQTQVDRVIDKYAEFLSIFPTVDDLARASAAEVIRAWKGLGYNRRALYLKRTAEAVVRDYGGVFPKDIAALKSLPGIGDYTARAILSFAFGEPVPMMDTNHRRFYQRVFFGNRIQRDDALLRRAEEVVATVARGRGRARRVYDFNQALMDFGSLVCTTRQPLCGTCPLRAVCRAYPGILQLPIRSRKVVKKRGKDAGLAFEETDRYFRGRIIDTLRNHERMSEKKLRTMLAELPDDRFYLIVRGLEKDGLIVRRQTDILLP